MNVDVQSHVFPQAYAELLVDASGSVTTERVGPSRYRLRYGDTQVFMLDLEDYSPERKLAAMDAAGIDVSVLSVNIPSPSRLPPAQRLAGARICNEYLADLVGSSGGRFAAIASLPLPDVDESVAELRRAVHDLGLRGVFLCSHLDGINLDDRSLETVLCRSGRPAGAAGPASDRPHLGRPRQGPFHDSDGRLHGGHLLCHAAPDPGAGSWSGTRRCRWCTRTWAACCPI